MPAAAFLLCFWTHVASAGAAQVQAGPAADKSAAAIQALLAQGKTAEAVRAARRAPGAAEAALRALLAEADLEITDRKIDDASLALQKAAAFAQAYNRANKAAPLAMDPLEGRRLRLEGIQLNDRKEYGKAEVVLRQALEIGVRAKDRSLEAGARNNLGYALRHQDKLEEAVAEFEAARLLAEGQNDLLRAGSYNFNLGEALLALYRNEPALQAFRRSAEQNAAASRKSLEGSAYLRQGVALSRINSVSPEAIRLFEKGRRIFEELGDDRNAGWSYYLAADHSAYRNPAEAAAFAERAIPFFDRAGDKAGLLQIYQFLTDMYQRTGEKGKAQKYSDLARRAAP
jgi:tetratricopeptide (TPR) repeat protein